MNASSSSDQDTVDRLAEEFVARHRRGERPALAEYAERFPQHAEAIRDLFPALVLIEQVKPGAGDPTGSCAGAAAAEPGPAAGAAGRLPHPPRGGPRRHGRRLRGRAGVAGPARGAQGPARPRPARPPATGPVPAARRGRRRGCTTPTSCRSSASASRTGCTTTSCSSSRARRSTRSWTSCGGCGGPTHGRRLPRSRAISPAAGDSAHEVSAAAVARSLLTGRFALHEPDPGANGGETSDGQPPHVADRATRADPGPDRRRFLRRPATAPPRSPRPAGPTCRRCRVPGGGTGRAWPGSACRWPRRWPTPTARASSTATSSRRTCCSTLHGNVWVTDFGLAKASDGEDLTHTGDVVGTLRYMAPERFGGQSDAAGRRLQPGPDALRAADAAAGVRRGGPRAS